MTDLANRVFRIRPDETAVVFALGFLLLVNSLSIQASNIVSVSGFLETGGVNQILFVWIVDMALIIVATAAQSLIIDRFNRPRLIGWMCFAFGLCYVVLRLMFVVRIPEWLNYSLLYFLTDQQWLFFPVLFWVLANDIFDPTQAKRLFPLISSFGFAGKLIGIGFTLVSPRLFAALGAAASEVLLVNVFLYLIAYAVVQFKVQGVRIRQTTPASSETLQAALSEGWGFVKEVLSFRYLVIALLALAICDTIVEFRFLVVIDAATGTNFQTFYAFYKLGTTLLAIVLQSIVTSRLLEKLHLKNSFFIMPIVALSSTLLLISSSAAVSAVIAYALIKLTDGTINESARKAFQALVPEERRGRVSMFMDSYLLASGTIIGSILTGLVVFGSRWLNITAEGYSYLSIGGVAALSALICIGLMRRAYDNSLLNWRLKRRQRGTSMLDKIS